MKIARVTLTGADESVEPRELLEISCKYPFVEWGILFSASKEGQLRYPGTKWAEELLDISEKHPLHCAAHICGKWARDLLFGDLTFCHYRCYLLPLVQRIQVNSNLLKSEIRIVPMAVALGSLHKYIIFQRQGDFNNTIICAASLQSASSVDISVLYDRSGGKGITPEEWIKPMKGFHNGYAGGLGPDNLETELKKIEKVAGSETIWIDMETNIRSKNDEKFDMKKVKEVLDIVEESGYLDKKIWD